METMLNSDSLDIVVEDRRWVKKETDEIHTRVTEADVYVVVRVAWQGNFRNPRFGAEQVCKACFDEISKKCRRTIRDE